MEMRRFDSEKTRQGSEKNRRVSKIPSRVFVKPSRVLKKPLEGFGNTFQGFRETLQGSGKTLLGFENTLQGFCETIQGSGKTLLGFENTLQGFGETIQGSEKSLLGFENTFQGFCETIQGSGKTLLGFENTFQGSHETMQDSEKTRRVFAGFCGLGLGFEGFQPGFGRDFEAFRSFCLPVGTGKQGCGDSLLSDHRSGLFPPILSLSGIKTALPSCRMSQGPGGKPHDRPPPLQIRQKDRRRTHPAQRRQHPRQGVSVLPALEGTAEAEARRMERRRLPLSLSLPNELLQSTTCP